MSGTAEDSFHVLLVISVPVDVAEFAADVLWSAGAQAVEEIHHGALIDLRTDLGSDPLQAWNGIIETTHVARDWKVRTESIDTRVADTWRQHASITVVGNVRVAPAWLTPPAAAQSETTILVEPGGSFGMGDHPTTRATLDLALQSPGVSVLDLGCGSGVLGIALCLSGHARVVAVDIAPAAIEATRHNVALNGVSDRFVIEQGDVRRVKGTYDLVLANILAPVLLGDADDIAARVASRGNLIVSGFTGTRRSDIIARYSALGLELRREIEVDGWLALQFERV
jgi:ribosomal protein L11 methyltransferase